MDIRLSPVQKQIVDHGDGPLLVIAGPGSGKTRVLTERIRRILTEDHGHYRILALTFTNKAANEMKDRLKEVENIDQRTFIGTIHSFCLEVLTNRGKYVGIENLPNIFESTQDRKQVLIQAISEYPDILRLLSRDNGRQNKIISEWLETISFFKCNLIMPEMCGDPTLKTIYETYNNNLRASNAIDFDDLLLLTYRLFIERPKIADFYRRQYRYICIDEAQDLNEAQYQVIKSLCGIDYKNIMMVGDPKQAIFVFTGASPKYLNMFKQDFDAKEIEMNDNYRSSKAVVKATKALDPNYKIEGSLPIEGSIDLLVGENEAQEVNLVLDYLDKLIKNGHKDIEGTIRLEQCAILGRTRYVLSKVEDELKLRNWKYTKQLSQHHESESDLLQNFELCLRIFANPHDQLHLGMLLKSWKLPNDTYLKNASFKDSLELIDALRKRVKTKDQSTVLQAIDAMEWKRDSFNFSKALDKLSSYADFVKIPEERALIMEDISVWRKHWDSYIRSNHGNQYSLASLLSQIALGATQQNNQEGISLLTVHSAKGLEFDIVVIMGMVEGIFPDYRARDDKTLEEEQRNAFVAISRSKRILAFSYPHKRIMPWGDEKSQKPSRYLKILGLIS
jgi:DNA helicase-2/ATP-dependent DNA helicase PcrA